MSSTTDIDIFFDDNFVEKLFYLRGLPFCAFKKYIIGRCSKNKACTVSLIREDGQEVNNSDLLCENH